MKTFVTFLSIFISIQAYSQFAPESDPHRGLYVDKFVKTDVNNSSILDPAFSILGVDTNRDGIFEKEEALLKYAAENHFTYLALFDLHRVFGRNFMVWDENLKRYVNLEDHLDRFLRKAKSFYGINQLGAVGGSENFFDSLATYMSRHPRSDFDVVNVEYEFWLSCNSDFPNFVSILDSMNVFRDNYNLAHPANPIFTEAYLANLNGCNSSYGVLPVAQTIDGCSSCSPCATCTNPQPAKIDRILHAWFVWDPGSINIAEQNVFENALTQDSTDLHPILYAESYNTGGTVDWSGAWFPNSPYNNIFTAEESYYSHWRNNSGVAFGTTRQNNVQPGGAQWFTSTNMIGYLDNPSILQNTGPYCTTNLLQQITFEYYGPIENDIPFEFWITKNDDNSTVYPIAGGRINGISDIYQPLTGTTTLNKSIDFGDTTIFPVCLLTEGNYSAHLKLKYSNGQAYQCNNRVIINHSPRIQIVGDSSFCEGKYTYLHINEPVASYTWYKNNSIIYSSPYLKVTEDGDYFCMITNGICPGNTDTVHIHVLPNPEVDLNAVCNGNGTATIKTNLLPASLISTSVAGPGGLIYRWNTNDSTDQIIVTPPNTNTNYRVNVTNPYNGCTRTAQIFLKSPLSSPYPSSITINNQPSQCLSDGSITANLSGGGAPNNFHWSNGATTPTISGLPAGTYVVAMNVWASGCTSYDSVTIGTLPANGPAIVPIIQNATCSNSSDGSIQLSISGGNSPFTFHWLNFPDDSVHNPYSKDQSDLFPGIYTLRITDASGCIFNNSFTVSVNHTNPQIQTIITTPVTGCATSANGTATVTLVNGGAQPYTYSWDEPQHQTDSIAISLSAGSVRVIVTDANGCNDMALASVASVQLPIHIQLLDSSRTVTSCQGINDANIFLNIDGGTSPYTVSSPWTADSNFAMQINLLAGIYPLQVIDAGGCSYADSFTVSSPQPVNVFTSATKATCIGCQNGSLTVSFTGGTPSYQISWQPSTGTLLGNSIYHLPAGIYNVCVTDKFGCSDCVQDTITESTQGVFSFEQNSFITVNPNPFSDYTMIEIQNRKIFSGTFCIYNSKNILVYHSNIFSPKFTIRETDFSPGIYFLKILDEHSQMIGLKKLVFIKN